MEKICRGIVLAGMFALIAACGGPELDTSSQHAMAASIGEIVKDMSAEERISFQRDLQAITLSYMDIGSLDFSKMQEGEARLAADLHGKTAKDVKSMAEKIRN